jgi:hypothetical protein
MRSKGIEAYGVPRQVRVVMPVGLRVWATVKQVLGYMLWRIGVLL